MVLVCRLRPVGARALIEAWVIVYLFQTQAQTRGQVIVLAAFEIALIGLITVTVGPALRSLGYGLPMRQSLPEPLFSAWNFGIAAYTSLMMGAAGFAYRAQPEDASRDAEVEALRAGLAAARAEHQETRRALEQARAEIAVARTWDGLPARTKATLIAAVCDDGDRPTAVELAEILGASRATVSAGYKAANGESLRAPSAVPGSDDSSHGE